MSLQSDRELINTRNKLLILEEEYESARTNVSEPQAVREASMQSLKRLINQLKEEIARYETHQPATRNG